MRNYKFYKEENGDWYADIPEWTGSKSELQMVEGADLFLDILAEGNDTIYLILSAVPFVSAERLHLYTRPEHTEDGAYYTLKQYKNIKYNLQMWLCAVTHWLFGDYPDIIYFK